MLHRIYELTLVLQGPVLSQASGTLAFGLDAAMQRYHDEPVLNGSLVRGNLRHVFHLFNKKTSKGMTDLKRWFPDEDDKTFSDQRSPLVFDMFWRPLLHMEDSRSRTRINIETDTGKVEKGALAIFEDLYPSGSCVPFHGSIHARFKDEDECQSFERWLIKALQWLAALGSQKGVGYGKLLWHELLISQPAPPAYLPPLPGDSTRLRLALSLDRPFCIGRQVSKEDNRIISSTAIPGHVIKGVLARKVAEETGKEGGVLSAELNKQLDFDRLTIGHARPVPCDHSDERPPAAIPMNLALADGQWWQFVSGEPPSLERAPLFQPDWKGKNWGDAARHLGLPDKKPERYLLVRTAIDPNTGAAKENQLFSLECVDPSGFRWVAEIDLSGIGADKRGKVLAELQRLLVPGLDSIGKTRARASVELRAAAPTEEVSATGPWEITLQTPARMLSLDFCPPGANGQMEVRQAYADYWRDQSKGAVTLEAHFAQQRLTGGEYYHQHFRKKNGKTYATELLTEPGSVFILKASQGKEADAKTYLEIWLRQNLPAWEDAEEPASWNTTVHIPQHGYGEIRVRDLKLKEECHD